MPVMEQFEVEAPVDDEIIARTELEKLAQWFWEMQDQPEESPGADWFWAEEELQRQRLTTACEAGKEPGD